jgi:hypothetical protein
MLADPFERPKWMRMEPIWNLSDTGSMSVEHNCLIYRHLSDWPLVEPRGIEPLTFALRTRVSRVFQGYLAGAHVET